MYKARFTERMRKQARPLGIGIYHPYSLNAPGHVLSTRQGLNRITLDDIYREYITWIDPLGGLRPKITFYADHFMELRDL